MLLFSIHKMTVPRFEPAGVKRLLENVLARMKESLLLLLAPRFSRAFALVNVIEDGILH